MPNPIRELFFGPPTRELARSVEPRRTFADVVLPPATRRALDHALVQIRKHDVLFGDWGLGERHDSGLGLAFNFAGPPGTGKTICAEAIAHSLGRRLLAVRYDELESQWVGATAKNVATVFAVAQAEEAVLFFDEADAIAARRFTNLDQGYQREANSIVNVLLRELEQFPGVVIFATNLAANFDPAFERRIRTHILFEMPGPGEREQIWRGQVHHRKTPLADDVDFAALAERFAVSGGDIKNGVLKAAQRAIAEPGPDASKMIRQAHFVAAMEEVVSAKKVMGQSLLDDGAPPLPPGLLPSAGGDDGVRDEVDAMALRLVEMEDAMAAVPDRLARLEGAHEALGAQLGLLADAVARAEQAAARRTGTLTWMAAGALALAAAALGAILL